MNLEELRGSNGTGGCSQKLAGGFHWRILVARVATIQWEQAAFPAGGSLCPGGRARHPTRLRRLSETLRFSESLKVPARFI